MQREIDQVYRGAGIRAQSMINPLGSGYDPDFRSDAGTYSPPRAKARPLSVFRRRLTSAPAEVKARRAGRSQNPAILDQLAQAN